MYFPMLTTPCVAARRL